MPKNNLFIDVFHKCYNASRFLKVFAAYNGGQRYDMKQAG